MQSERTADLMMQFPDAVTDARGAFHARTMARERHDGTWEGWLEFVPADAGAATRYTTPIETHQRDRVTMERWASGLTHVYAEGALSRARHISEPAAGPMIPGARERNTLTWRQPGSMGGPASGSDVGGVPSELMDATTIAEHRREGGGAPSSRKGR
jgi:hypothetical protein